MLSQRGSSLPRKSGRIISERSQGEGGREAGPNTRSESHLLQINKFRATFDAIFGENFPIRRNDTFHTGRKMTRQLPLYAKDVGNAFGSQTKTAPEIHSPEPFRIAPNRITKPRPSPPFRRTKPRHPASPTTKDTKPHAPPPPSSDLALMAIRLAARRSTPVSCLRGDTAAGLRVFRAPSCPSCIRFSARRSTSVPYLRGGTAAGLRVFRASSCPS